MIIAVVLVTLGTAEGELYRWVDEDGMVHFDETRPADGASPTKVAPVPNQGAGQQDVQGPGPEGGAGDESSKPGPEPIKTPEGRVELYVTSWCLYCKMAADFLHSRKIPFTLYDIEKDREAALRKMRLDPSPGVPLALINGFLIRGFSTEAYEKALAYGEKPQN